MKIRLNVSPSRGAHWIREGVKLFQYPLALIAVIIVASLLPGDNQHISTLGAAIGLAMLGLIDAAVSVPALIVAKKLDRPAVPPVAVRNEW